MIIHDMNVAPYNEREESTTSYGWNRLSLRNNRWKFKTPWKLPIDSRNAWNILEINEENIKKYHNMSPVWLGNWPIMPKFLSGHRCGLPYWRWEVNIRNQDSIVLVCKLRGASSLKSGYCLVMRRNYRRGQAWNKVLIIGMIIMEVGIITRWFYSLF